ncbi:unnamed protein product [Nesidiocoris tenuis]|uniref:Uncharacterized protein n=1 Tax=Nesidiocoris tenuis TaxID=355587 RepID=A0A6H5GFF5_9HEMI|nr:unnamed protein product [Nesidiocoris tenuis]
MDNLSRLLPFCERASGFWIVHPTEIDSYERGKSFLSLPRWETYFNKPPPDRSLIPQNVWTDLRILSQLIVESLMIGSIAKLHFLLYIASYDLMGESCCKTCDIVQYRQILSTIVLYGWIRPDIVLLQPDIVRYGPMSSRIVRYFWILWDTV